MCAHASVRMFVRNTDKFKTVTEAKNNVLKSVGYFLHKELQLPKTKGKNIPPWFLEVALCGQEPVPWGSGC